VAARRAKKSWQLLGFGFLLGITALCASFVGGMYFQHNDARKRLQKIIQKDPYAYYVSPKIYEVVGEREKSYNSF